MPPRSLKLKTKFQSAMDRDVRYIFLDVDGVLHPMGTNYLPLKGNFREGVARAEAEAENASKPGYVYPICAGEFLQDNMAALKAVVDATGASIVLSSTWRESDYSAAAVARKLAEHGIPPFVSCTPARQHVCGPARRGAECAAWLLEHGREGGGPVSFVVVDDGELTLGSPELDAAHFVRTKMDVGLTPADADRIIELLRVPVPSDVPTAEYLAPASSNPSRPHSMAI